MPPVGRAAIVQPQTAPRLRLKRGFVKLQPA